VRESERGKDTATHCNTSQVFHGRHTHTTVRDETVALQHTATHCNTLQHTATHCKTLQDTATHCNTFRHDSLIRIRLCATRLSHCNTLQHTATHCNMSHVFHGRHDSCCSVLQCVAVCCSVLQCVAVCCSVLQCVAVCCSVFSPCATRLSSACGMTHACSATLCNTVQRTATHYNTFRHDSLMKDIKLMHTCIGCVYFSP